MPLTCKLELHQPGSIHPRLAMQPRLCCHGFIPHPTLTHVSLTKCSAAQAGLPGLLLSWLNMLQQQQQRLLAKKESHTKLRRERFQVQPQPEPASPQKVEGKMPGCILLAADPAPAAASWGGPPHCSVPRQASTSPCEHADPALPTACPHRQRRECCPAPACTSALTQRCLQTLPPTHCPAAARGRSPSTRRLE